METILSSTPPPIQPVQKKRYLLFVFLGLLAIVSIAVTAYLLFGNKKTPSSTPLDQTAQQAQISGSFNINGVIPAGATILIKQTDVASPNDASSASQSFPAVDQGTWSFTNGLAGKTYIITASVVSQGTTIVASDPITITAPATGETLDLNIPTQNPSGSAIISGNIQVNGYIPSGATISIKARKLGATTFSKIASNLTAAPSQVMTYSTAIAGQSYEVIGTLLDNAGNQIGSSSVLVITAPALNETLTINSQALPSVTPSPTLAPTATPAPTSAVTSTPTSTPIPTPVPTPPSISGVIDFNGVAPANSRIVVFQKVYNTQNYQVAVDNITPLNGSTWQWQGATLSTWYDMIAVLKQQQPNGTDVDIATSQMQSIAAPATNVTLTINSGIVLSAPSGSITASCGNLSGSTWNNGQVSFASVPNGQSYWLQVGTANGSNNTYNSMQNSNNQSNQTANIVFTNGTTYYARYAYATSQNAGQPQYSPFSATTQFVCSQ